MTGTTKKRKILYIVIVIIIVLLIYYGYTVYNTSSSSPTSPPSSSSPTSPPSSSSPTSPPASSSPTSPPSPPPITAYTVGKPGTSIPLTGVQFLGKQVYRYYNVGTIPRLHSDPVTLISSASALIRYYGGVLYKYKTQYHDLSMIGTTSSLLGHISPVFFNGTILTPGGNIQLYNNSASSNYDNQPYWVIIEYTVD